MDNQQRQRPFARRSDADTLDARRAEALESELRALPELEAPDKLWERVRERVDRDIDNRPSLAHQGRQVPMALAASVVIVALASVIVSVHLSTGDTDPATQAGIAGGSGIVGPGADPADHAAIIEALMEQSREAEEQRRAVLALYSPSSPEQVLRAQIGGIDAALNEQILGGGTEPKFREALLRDRVDLMANLTDIERYRQHEFVRQVSF